MSKKIAVLLAPGFEETKTVIVVDVMHRLNIEVEMLTCQDRLEIVGKNAIRMFGDALLERRKNILYDALIIPGGSEATLTLAENAEAIAFIRRHMQEDKWIGAIGSAAAHVLAGNQLLQGRKYVCSDDLYQDYADGVYTDHNVVEDRKVISTKGIGTTFEFAFTLGARLTGDTDIVEEKAEQIFYTRQSVE